MISRLKRWWRNRRQRRSEAPIAEARSDLREFVYLDETSVVSLLSSRLGKVPSEFSESLSNTAKVEISSNLEAGAPGVAKSNVGSRFESAQTEDTKMVSRATIQTGFRSLYQGEVDAGTLSLRPVLPTEPVPSAEDITALMETASHRGRQSAWVIPVDSLRRGDLLELEVELQADAIFHVSTMVSILSELARESNEIRSQVNRRQYERMLEMNGVLEKLMAGLVPIKCRLVDYVLVESGAGGSVLLHRSALEAIPTNQRPASQPVHLVAVLEKDLFWKDLRRVLFAHGRFRVLCRLSRDGLDESWNPVKLAEVLGEVLPEFSDMVELLGQNALGLMRKQPGAHGQLGEPRLSALVDYAELLADRLGVQLSGADRRRIEILAAQHAHEITSVPESRVAFASVAEFIEGQSGKAVQPTVAADLRVEAQRKNDMYPGGTSMPTAGTSSRQPTRQADDGKLLNAEVVAIYW